MSNFLTSYEFLVTSEDFIISVNGQVLPSACEGFSVNKDKLLIFRTSEGDIAGYPIPDEFIPLVNASKRILFVKFIDGIVVDSADLVKMPIL